MSRETTDPTAGDVCSPHGERVAYTVPRGQTIEPGCTCPVMWVDAPAEPDAGDVETLDEIAALALAEEIWEDEPTDAEQLLMQRVLTSDWMAAHDDAVRQRVLGRLSWDDGCRAGLAGAACIARETR